MEEALEALGIAGHHVFEGDDVVGTAEVQAEHGTGLGGDERYACGIGALLQAVEHAAGVVGQLGVEAWAADQLQGGQAGGHGQRVARQGAGLVDRAERGDAAHDFTLATEAADRHAATDDLAEGGQVRLDAVVALGAAQGNAEAGHHFVEDQHHAVLVALLAQAFEEARCRRYAVHVARHRLNDDAGHGLADVGQGLLDGGDVVERQGQGVLGEVGRYARRAWHALGQQAGTGFYQQAVGVAVVAAFELDDGITAGVATGQADGAHGGFGARADHAHHFHGRYQRADQVGHVGFHGGRCAIGQAVLQLLAYRLQHVRVAVAEDHRAPGTDIVDVALVVFVNDVGAFGMLEEQRRAAHAFESAHWRVDATGDVLLGFGEQVFRTGHEKTLSKSGCEQGVEGAGAAGNFLRAVGTEQAVDHRQQVGAVGDQRSGVVEGDAADHRDRQFHLGACLLQQLDVGSGRTRLGDGIEEAAKGHVAGPFADGLGGQVEAGVAGGADDRLAAEQGTGRGQRAIGLAQVHADAQACGQFGVVVDEQLGAVALAELHQPFGFAQAARGVVAFVAILQQAHAAFQCRLDMGQETAGEQLAVGDGVQTA